MSLCKSRQSVPHTSFRTRKEFTQHSVAQTILRNHSAPRNTAWMMKVVEEMSQNKGTNSVFLLINQWNNNISADI